MRSTGSRIKVRLTALLSAGFALALFTAGPAAAKPAGAGGGGPARTSGALVPEPGGAVATAGDIYVVLIAAATVVAGAVIAFAVLGHIREQRTASTKA